jgi:hypothetical protein
MTRRGRCGTAAAARAITVSAVVACLLTACTGSDDPSGQPPPSPSGSTAAVPVIRLGDVSVSPTALAQRTGLYVCGDSLVASAPAGGIQPDTFVVFDPDTGRGEITRVRLPGGMRPNARWLLTTECVDEGGPPLLSVAYQEMPLAPTGGSGIRAAYTLDGERLWMRRDLNQPALVVDDVLVLGAAPEQPETAVDLRTGETVATFDQAVQTRTVVAADRMVVRGISGRPVLTTLTGERIAGLDHAAAYTADGGLLFASTPSALPDTGDGAASPPGETPEGLTDASPSPSPTQSAPPRTGDGLPEGSVQAYALATGRPLWRRDIPPDPLGLPTVEPQSGVVVLVDVRGLAHGLDPQTGREAWRAPTELENPRVTAAAGIVLFDKVDEPFQKLVDGAAGLPLPTPQEPVLDLGEHGALQLVDGVATLVPPRLLRVPPTTGEENGP